MAKFRIDSIANLSRQLAFAGHEVIHLTTTGNGKVPFPTLERLAT